MKIVFNRRLARFSRFAASVAAHYVRPARWRCPSLLGGPFLALQLDTLSATLERRLGRLSIVWPRVRPQRSSARQASPDVRFACGFFPEDPPRTCSTPLPARSYCPCDPVDNAWLPSVL